MPRGELTDVSQLKLWGPSWARKVGQFLAYGYWHTTVHGREHFPATGPVIVASNHIGVVDGPLVFGVLPRNSHFLVKKEFFTSPLGFLMDWAGQVPVDRSNGRTALAIGKELLDDGRVVGIFPEGHRGGGRADTVKAGVAWLAVHSGAPIVPAACLGTRPAGASVSYVPRPRARLQVVLGEPFQVGVTGTGRQAVTDAIDVIAARMQQHVADAVALTGIELPGDTGRRMER